MDFNFEEHQVKIKNDLNDKMGKNLYNDVFRASIEFDIMQLEVLASNEDNILVYGPAGTGKTILAMSKIKELEFHNKAYIVVIYTKSLKAYIEGKMLLAGFNNARQKIYYENELDKYFEKNPDIKYDYIVIDEAQDFSLNAIELLKHSTDKGIFVYGDDKQSLYPQKTNNRYTIADIIESELIDKVFKLQSIYRFAKTIYDFANCINPNNIKVDFIKPKSHIQSSDVPKILEFNNLDDELNYIVTLIENNGWQNVGILVRTNEYAEIIRDWILRNSDSQSPYFKHIEAKTDDSFELDFSNNGIKIIPYHSSKGLEFDRVFIPICNANEEIDKNGNFKYNYREALYVAFTRAKYTLIVSYNLEEKHFHGNYRSPYLDEIDRNTYKMG